MQKGPSGALWSVTVGGPDRAAPPVPRTWLSPSWRRKEEIPSLGASSLSAEVMAQINGECRVTEGHWVLVLEFKLP